MFNDIVVPLDGSSLAEKAVPIAAGLARLSGATVHLVRVVSRSPELEASHISGIGTNPQEVEYARDIAKRLVETQIKTGRSYLDGMAEQLRKDGVTVETAVKEGAADEQVLEYARVQGADLIVMGTRGHGGLKRLFLGSVTDSIVRSSEVPVLVVPAN